MYRLIYLEPDTGYKCFDSNSGAEFDVSRTMLLKHKIAVICVVDYAKQAINNKCSDYSNHYGSIDGTIFDPVYVTQF